MKKVIGQTVRDLKRGVNKKVLKVPGIEQKVLDATSNESWGPHGSLLADIAHASRNHHEYQLTMAVLWKRLSDTGKNWRHVFKALTVLEYLVGHGSERVIDDIKERVYQISTLADFQYIDSSGKDQGSNVRKKSQSLVALVSDKERIAEIREKAAANRDKCRNTTVSGMNRPSGGYEDKYDYDGRYGDRDEVRSSYGTERDYGYRDDDRSSRGGDRYSTDPEDRYGKESVDNYQNESSGRNSDRERSLEDDGQSSSRFSGARADDQSQDGRGGLHRKFSEQNIGASPPSYEEAVSESRSPVYSERDGGETPQVAPPGATASPPAENNSMENKAADFVNESSPQQVEAFDEFDPRGSVSASLPAAGASAPAPAPSPSTVISSSAAPESNNTEMDLLGSLSDVFSPNPMAIVTSDSASVEPNGQANTTPAPSFSTSQSSTQPFDDPFGDSPFKAITFPDTDSSLQQNFGAPFQPTIPTSNPDNGQNFGFGDSFTAVSNHEPGVQNMQAPADSSVFHQENFETSESEIDVLAGILPPSGPSPSLSQPNPTMPTAQFPPSGNIYDSFNHQTPPADLNVLGQTPFGEASQQYNRVSHSQNHHGGMQFNNGGFVQQPGYAGSANSQPPQYQSSHPTSESIPHQPVSATSSRPQSPYPTTPNAPAGQFDGGDFMTKQVHGAPSHIPQQTQPGPVASPNAPAGQFDGGNFMTQQVHGSPSHIPQQTQPGTVASSNTPGGQFGGGNFMTQQGHGVPSHISHRTQSGPVASPNAPAGQFDGGNFMTQQGHGVPSQIPHRTQSGSVAEHNAPAGQFDGGNFMTQHVHSVPSHIPQRTQSVPVSAPTNKNNNVIGDMFEPAGLSSLGTSVSQPSLTPLSGAIEIVPQTQKKFEPKSTIWADTLSRGLVNFNISGPKTNPLSDIGVDFDAINRKEKRLEKPSPAQQQVTSTINMGKAMGSGTGLGRAGAGAMRPPTNSMVGSNMPMGMNVGGYGGMNQNQPMGMTQNYPMGMNQNHPMGMGMGMNQNHPMGMGMNQNYPTGMNQNHPMGMGMNMGGGYGQGYPMQQQQGMHMGHGPPQGMTNAYNPMQQQQGMHMAPGQQQGMNNAYNPMMGQGGYNPQQNQHYGRGYQ